MHFTGYTAISPLQCSTISTQQCTASSTQQFTASFTQQCTTFSMQQCPTISPLHNKVMSMQQCTAISQYQYKAIISTFSTWSQHLPIYLFLDLTDDHYPAWCPYISTHQCPYLSASSAKWHYQGLSNNKLSKIVNGNRRLGYNLGMWNCRRGLITGDKEASFKMVDVKNFIQSKNLHMLCLIEADLHSPISRYKRLNRLLTLDINHKLSIPGYKNLPT